MRIGDWPSRSFGCVDVGQQLQQRWPMPRFALESTSQLTLNSLHFTSHAELFPLCVLCYFFQLSSELLTFCKQPGQRWKKCHILSLRRVKAALSRFGIETRFAV